MGVGECPMGVGGCPQECGVSRNGGSLGMGGVLGRLRGGAAWDAESLGMVGPRDWGVLGVGGCPWVEGSLRMMGP